MPSTKKGGSRGPEARLRLAVLVGAIFNPFVLFTALFAATAFAEAEPRAAMLYVGVELIIIGALVIYLLVLRYRNSSGFWLPVKEERMIPAFVLLALGVATVTLLDTVVAPPDLIRLTIAMLVTASLVTVATLWIKASAHVAVASHCAVAALTSIYLPGLVFLALVPLIIWARITERAHTPAEVAVGAFAGASIAAVAALI